MDDPLAGLRSLGGEFAPINADHPNADDNWTRAPAVRRRVHAILVERGRVATFLAEKRIALAPEARDLFLETLEDEFIAAIALLRRRTKGNFSRTICGINCGAALNRNSESPCSFAAYLKRVVEGEETETNIL